jgi:Ni/Fe-hydrogenase subunit HybB-like protein
LSGGEHHPGDFDDVAYAKVNEDILNRTTTMTWKYWLALGIAGLFVLGGAAVYYWQTTVGLGVWGVNEPNYWGLDLPSFIFWIGFSLSGTLLSAILLLTRSHWRNPIYRLAEASTGIALMTAGVVIATHVGRPWRLWYNLPYPNLRELWTNFRSPLNSDVLGMMAYLIASMLFLIVGSIPDFAVMRDHTTGWRKKLYTVLAMGWRGSDEQWRHFRRAYLLIACFIIPIAVSMHTVTSWVPSMTMNPGTRSNIFPMYFVTGALLSGVAGVIMIAILVRRFMHLQEYIKVKYLDHLAKLVLLASMLITYIYIIELFVPWYELPVNYEFAVLASKLYGPFAPLYWTMILFNSLIPLAFFSRKVRRSIPALFLISAGVQIAMYFERYLMIIPMQTVGPMPATWTSYSPSWVELVLLVWGLSVFVFLYLGFVKLVPVVSIFEVKELLPVPKRSEPMADAPDSSGRTGIAAPAASSATALLSANRPTVTAGGNRSNAMLGLFSYVNDAIGAVAKLREAGFEKIEIQSPVPSDEIDAAMIKHAGSRRAPAGLIEQFGRLDLRVAHFAAIGAVGAGILTAIFAGWSAVVYPIQTGGLPIIALPTVGFTAGLFAALGGLIFSVVGVFVLGRIPSRQTGLYSPAVSRDRFALIVKDCDRERFELCGEILAAAGANEIMEGSS